MAGKEKADIQELVKNGDDPPPYDGQQNDQAPPGYRDVQAAARISATHSPYRAFPSTMSACATWTHWKTFHLSDATSNEPIFFVDVHTGYSGKPPLGSRPGLNLHNGKAATDPILAAVGDESQFAARAYTFNSSSIILLPALEPGANYTRMDTERMHGAPSEEHDATFSFSIEVGKTAHREDFEWRKFNKSSGDNNNGGFKLVRLLSRKLQDISGGSDGPDPSASSSRTDTNCESIAVLTLISLRSSLMKLFTLELLGSAKTGELGDRCMLTIIMTALRLWSLRLNGKTTKKFNSTSEKLRRNEY